MSDDLISRQAAIVQLSHNKNGDDDCDVIIQKDIETIKALPPVKPEQKMGRWITKDGKEQGYDIGGVKTWYIQIVCSRCGFIKTAIEGITKQYNYCPNCGAKMEVEE